MDDLNQAQEQPIAPRWAGRVPKWKIARLYENDATGVLDEELIDDVAYTFLARCESMIVAAEAHRGRAACPVCGQLIEHDWDKKAELCCAGCGWTGQWEAYWRSYKGKRLLAGGLEPFCREYIQRLPAAGTAREKMLLIDWLIHRFHWESRDCPGRPGAVGLIGGRAREVNAFLDALSLGEHNDPRLRQGHEAWRDVQQRRLTETERRLEAKRKQRGR